MNSQTQQQQQQPDPKEKEEISEEAEKNERKIKEKTHDAEAAASLDRVTDFAEEMEISAGDISGVMGLITQEVAGRLEKEKELMKVKIKKEDVEILVHELEMPQVKAERALREHDGNLIEALRTLTN